MVLTCFKLTEIYRPKADYLNVCQNSEMNRLEMYVCVRACVRVCVCLLGVRFECVCVRDGQGEVLGEEGSEGSA